MAWLRTLTLWVAFLAALLLGAALTLSPQPALQWTGLALLAAPTAALVFLTLAHYAKQRRQARP